MAEHRRRSRLLLSLTIILSLLPSSFCCTDEYLISSSSPNCVQVKDGSSTSCRSLVDIMSQKSANSTADHDCSKRLVFSPGEYTLSLPANTNVTVNHSIIMTGPEGGVTLTCSSTNANRINGYGKALIFQRVEESSTTLPEGFVELSGITFAQCNHSLKFKYLEKVAIRDCTFRNFKAQTVDIYNSLEVLVANSSFINNVASTLNEPYHGDSGGLSVGYHYTQHPHKHPTALITGCTFENNRADISELVLDQQLEQIFENHQYPARGGGLGLIITEDNANVSVNIEKCYFKGNLAQSAGGGGYISVNGLNTNHSIWVSDCQFDNNTSIAGGGLVVAFLSDSSLNIPSIVNIVDSMFFGNRAEFAGGMLMIQTHSFGSGSYLRLIRSNFTMNRVNKEGSAVVFGSLISVHSEQAVLFSVVDSCLFTQNAATGGTLVVGFTHLNITGNNLFEKNIGPSLRVVGSMIHVIGNLSFIGNDGRQESATALDVSGFGQVRIFKQGQMNFINNMGTVGAAIGVTVQKFPLVYSRFLYNLQCFLLYENTTVPPSQWEKGRIRFYGNKAQSGSAITVSYLDLCSWFTDNDTNPSDVFRIDKFPDWPVFEFGENTNTLHDDSTARRYYVQTPAASLQTPNSTIRLTPGQSGFLKLAGFDQLGSPTSFIAQLSDGQDTATGSITELFNVSSNATTPAANDDLGSLQFVPSLIPVTNQSLNILYGLMLSNEEANQDQYINVSRLVTISVLDPIAVIARDANATLVVAPCPPGYSLRVDGEGGLATCLCVGAEDTPFATFDCDGESNTVLMRDGYWAGFDTDDDEAEEPHLDVYQCPVPYCQCQKQQDSSSCSAVFFYNDPGNNKQCHPPRHGTLCGSCGNGTIVTVLRMLCRDDCLWDQGFYITTVVLVIADIAVIVLILMLSVKFGLLFPNSLKPLLFYIQIVYYSTEYFPISFWDARAPMLYIGNFLGLYLPYDFCFIRGADLTWSFLPRFIPPLLVFIIPPFFLLFKRARLRIWNGVWTLVLLTYAPLCYTCVMLLNCPRLPLASSGEQDLLRWFLDAQTRCFMDYNHIVMGVLAFIFLIGLALLIPAVILLVVFQRKIEEKYSVMRTVSKALMVGYKKKFEWWAGIELAKRFLLILFVVSMPGRTVVPLFLITAIFTVQLYFKPYRHWLPNLIDAAIFLNCILFFILRYPQYILDLLAPYSGTMVPSSSGKNLPPSDRITWFFLLGFYGPVAGGIIGSIAWVVWLIIKRFRHKKGSKVTTGINRGYSIDTQDNNEEDYEESYRPPYIGGRMISVEHTVTSTDITDILNQEEEEDEEEQVIENHRVEVITRQEQTEDYNEQ